MSRFNTNLLPIGAYRVPLREIHEIEFSSRCNLACRYCPHPKMKRAKADMTEATFQHTMRHLAHLLEIGTQGEVSVTGIGEAILHPKFGAWVEIIRDMLGVERHIVVSTNGVALTDEIAECMGKNQVRVYVSTHRPEKAGPAVQLLKKHGCAIGVNTAFVDDAIDWAGQVDWHVSDHKIHSCAYLERRWGAVRQDGSINTCCMDAESLYPIGHVSQSTGTLTTQATDLCKGCHLAVTPEFREGSAYPPELVQAVLAAERLQKMVMRA